jgi:dihydroorotate dehydrogenase electron transfer subunit
LLTWAAPSLARRVTPGQYLHLLAPRPAGLLLPALPVAGSDRAAGHVQVLLDEGPGPARELLRLRDGDRATFDGPLGRGFEVDARSRHLLMVADEAGYSRVRAAIGEAVADGRRVTVLYGAASVAEVFPSSLLPDEAEYVVATADGSLGHRGPVTDLVTEYEAWADQCLAAGSEALLARMAALAKGRESRMGVARLGRRRVRRGHRSAADVRRRAWLQVALSHEAGCALGVCLGCVASGERGLLRVCREGPAFAASELRWEPVA